MHGGMHNYLLLLACLLAGRLGLGVQVPLPLCRRATPVSESVLVGVRLECAPDSVQRLRPRLRPRNGCPRLLATAPGVGFH